MCSAGGWGVDEYADTGKSQHTIAVWVGLGDGGKARGWNYAATRAPYTVSMTLLLFLEAAFRFAMLY